MGLTDVADHKVGTFSLGMRQRLGIASTVLGDPEILIYDEPLNGLDPVGVEMVREFLIKHAAAGRAVLLSSHLLHEIELSADRIVVLGRGRVLYEGALDAFSDAAVEVEIESDDEAVRRVIAMAGRRGWQVSKIADSRGSVVLRVSGATVAEVTAEVTAAGGELRGVQQRSSLEHTYRQLTYDRVEFGRSNRNAGARP